MTTNAAGIQGQGIEMAEAIGAATVDMDQIQIHPTVEANTAALITEGLRGDGAVLINAEGKRFIDEVGTRDVVSAAEIAQTGSYSWLVVDQAMADASSAVSYTHLINVAMRELFLQIVYGRSQTAFSAVSYTHLLYQLDKVTLIDKVTHFISKPQFITLIKWDFGRCCV